MDLISSGSDHEIEGHVVQYTYSFKDLFSERCLLKKKKVKSWKQRN